MNRANHVIGTATLVAWTLFAVSFQVHAQERRGPTRIRFKRGQSSITLKGQLSSRRLEQAFLFGAQAGQELYLRVRARSSDGLDFATFLVYDPFGKPLGSNSEGDVRTRLRQTGDYRIEVSPPGSFYRENVKGYKQLQFILFLRIQ